MDRLDGRNKIHIDEENESSNVYKKRFKEIRFKNSRFWKDCGSASDVVVPLKCLKTGSVQHTCNLEQMNDMKYSKCSKEFCQPLYGLNAPKTWESFQCSYPPGLKLVRNIFNPAGQRYWITKCLLNYPKTPHITNLDNEVKKFAYASKTHSREEFYKKLRWITFGYHHDWDTKVYNEKNKCPFPKDLAQLLEYLSIVLNENFRAEAAIVNFYKLNSTLSGHVDRSEDNCDAPLYSISFGQPAVFLIGGRKKSDEAVPLILRSGDLVIMTGESRHSFHGVPKVFQSKDEPWKTDGLSKQFEPQHFEISACENCSNIAKDFELTNSEKFLSICKNYDDFVNDYITKSRININVRQVLFPDQKALFNDSDDS